MFQKLRFAIVFLIACFCHHVIAAPIKNIEPGSQQSSTPMTFKVATVCEMVKNCQVMVEASGWIEANSGKKFQELSSSLAPGIIVLLNSTGGDLLGGIELGQAIRAKQFKTRIGVAKAIPQKNRRYEFSDMTFEPGLCYSACALAFMGGTQRTFDAQSTLGMHPLKARVNQMNHAPSARSAQERLKQVADALGRYTEEMGIDRRVIDYLMVGGEDLKKISVNAARQLNLDNSQQSRYPWRIQATDNGQLITLVTEKQSKNKVTMTLALSKKSGTQFELIIYVKGLFQAQTPAANKQLEESLEKILIPGRMVSINPSDMNTRFNLKPSIDWRKSGDGYQFVSLLSNEQLDTLMNALEIQVELMMPNNPDVDVLTYFGTHQLRSGFNAIRRQ
jgi:hypothetical protein